MSERTWRISLAVVSIVLCVLTVLRVVTLWPDDSNSEICKVPFNELTQLGIKMRVDSSQSMFQINLVILAALWGLVIARKDEVRLVMVHHSTVLLFVLANACLLGSSLAHLFLVHGVSSDYFTAGRLQPANQSLEIPNAFVAEAEFWHLTQHWFFYPGVIVGIMTLISAHWFKEQ